MSILLAACPATDTCVGGGTMSGDQAGFLLVAFIVACCVFPFLFARRRRR